MISLRSAEGREWEEVKVSVTAEAEVKHELRASIGRIPTTMSWFCLFFYTVTSQTGDGSPAITEFCTSVLLSPDALNPPAHNEKVKEFNNNKKNLNCTYF